MAKHFKWMRRCWERLLISLDWLRYGRVYRTVEEQLLEPHIQQQFAKTRHVPAGTPAVERRRIAQAWFQQALREIPRQGLSDLIVLGVLAYEQPQPWRTEGRYLTTRSRREWQERDLELLLDVVAVWPEERDCWLYQMEGGEALLQLLLQ